MRMTLLRLTEKIKEAIGTSPMLIELCEDIAEIKEENKSIGWDFDTIYVAFDIISYDCENLASDKNVVEIKKVQTPQKKQIIKESGNVIFYIPEFDWYEFHINGTPQYFGAEGYREQEKEKIIRIFNTIENCGEMENPCRYCEERGIDALIQDQLFFDKIEKQLKDVNKKAKKIQQLQKASVCKDTIKFAVEFQFHSFKNCFSFVKEENQLTLKILTTKSKEAFLKSKDKKDKKLKKIFKLFGEGGVADICGDVVIEDYFVFIYTIDKLITLAKNLKKDYKKHKPKSINVTAHNRKIEDVKKECGGSCETYETYETYIDRIDDITLFFVFFKDAKNKRYVKIFSFGENKNYVTETLPIIYAGEAKKAIIQQLSKN